MWPVRVPLLRSHFPAAAQISCSSFEPGEKAPLVQPHLFVPMSISRKHSFFTGCLTQAVSQISPSPGAVVVDGAAVVVGAPVVDGTPPVVDGTPPVVDGTPPVVDGTPPVVDGTPPVVDGTPPVVDGTPPVVDGTPPVVD
eukprot:Selendium_serpulae@DN6364_c5_g1_i27.p2